METLIKILITSFSAILGYALREYQSKIYPFSKILGIAPGITNAQKEVELEEEIIQRFNKTTILPSFEIPTTLGSISKVKSHIINFKNNKSSLIESIDILIENLKSKQSSYDRQLISILKSDFFYTKLRKLIYYRAISFPEIEEDDTKKQIEFVRNKDYDGNVLFEFPSQTIGFGSDFDDYDYLYKAMEPFILAISQRDVDFLIKLFSEFKELYVSAENNLDHYLDKIEKQLNEYSQWGFLFFVANNSSKPFVLGNKGTFKLNNKKTKAKFTEELYFVEITEDEKGEKGNRDYQTDIIIKSGESLNIIALTKKIENEMENGLSIRNTYEKAQGKFSIEIPLYRNSLLKKSKLKIKNVTFSNDKEISSFY